MIDDINGSRMVAQAATEQKRWLYGLTYERADSLVINNRWSGWVGNDKDSADFFRWAGRDVLLPVEAEHHPHLRVVQSALSVDETLLFLLVKDVTFAAEHGFDVDDAWVAHLAVCVRAPGNWYVAVLYHETLVDPDSLGAPVRS